MYKLHNALRDIARTLGLFKDHIHATLEGQIGVLKVGSDIGQDGWAEEVATYRSKLLSKLNGNGEA